MHQVGITTDGRPVDMKRCTKCAASKPLSDYRTYQSKALDRVVTRPECKTCSTKYNAEYHRRMKIRLSQRKKEIRALRGPDYGKELYAQRREHAVEYARKMRVEHREKKLAEGRRHYQENKAAYIERNARRRAYAAAQTPSWLSPEQRATMRAFYRDTPPAHQVDHIVPLRGQDAWGLHVPWNLQYLPAEENRRKYNKLG